VAISNGFGSDPRWRSDGRELYYRSRSGELLLSKLRPPGVPGRESQRLGVLTFTSWDSAGDGRRFLRLATMGGPQPTRWC